MSDLGWERTGHRLTKPLTEESLRRALERSPDTRSEWIGIRRARTMLYISRMGSAFDVVFQDDVDTTWRAWVTEPQPDQAGVRPQLELATAWAMEFIAAGRVAGVLRDSEEDRVLARGLKELLLSEVTAVAQSAPPPLALQLHLHRQRREAAAGVLVGDWGCERLTPLVATSRQLELAALEAPWCVDELTFLFFDVLRLLNDVVPAGVLRVLVLDDLPIEHAIAAAEVLHGADATRPWRDAVPHDTARLWTYRGDLKKFGKAQPAEPRKPGNGGPSQTGFDFS